MMTPAARASIRLEQELEPFSTFLPKVKAAERPTIGYFLPGVPGLNGSGGG
jgi:hypothetical protein